MADEWDGYIVEDTPQDEWEQYAVMPKETSSKPPMERQNIMGKIFNVPGAAIRSGLMGQGYIKGALNPSSVPTFQNSMLDNYYRWVEKSGKNFSPAEQSVHRAILSAPGLGVSALGYGLDTITQPANVALGLASKLSAVKSAVGSAVNSKAGQAIGQFLTKKRSFLKFGKDAVLNIAEKGVAGLDKLDDMAIQRYGEQLKTIKGSTKSVDPIINQIDEAVNTYPEEGFATIKNIKKRISKQAGLSAEELRNIKMEIKKGVPKTVFQGKADPTPQQYELLKVYNKVDDELISLGGDKYRTMKKEYSEWKNIATDAYRALLEDGRPGDKNLRNWFGYGLSRRQMKALDKSNFMLPKDEQFMQDFYAWRRGQALKGAGAAAIPASYLLHRAVAEKTIGK